MTYKEFCDNDEDIIFDEIDNTIKSLNLPKRIETEILSIIYDESYEILEERYNRYDEFKDSRIN